LNQVDLLISWQKIGRPHTQPHAEEENSSRRPRYAYEFNNKFTVYIT
jgi:hypothetical protein